MVDETEIEINADVSESHAAMAEAMREQDIDVEAVVGENVTSQIESTIHDLFQQVRYSQEDKQ